MRIAILQQSYGRFGGAERLALSHYIEMRRRGLDVTFYYTGTMSRGWEDRLDGEPIRSIPTAILNRPKRFRLMRQFLEELKQYDKIIIHHHIEPVLAFYLSKVLGPRIIWYSGSMFVLAWEEITTGIDYRRISPTVSRTGDGQESGNLKDSRRDMDDPVDVRGTMNGQGALAQAYGGCKFLVHHSLYEPGGLPPFEARLFSEPSLVTRHSAPPEVGVDGS